MVAKSLVTTQVYVACAPGNIREPILGVGPKSSSETVQTWGGYRFLVIIDLRNGMKWRVLLELTTANGNAETRELGPVDKCARPNPDSSDLDEPEITRCGFVVAGRQPSRVL